MRINPEVVNSVDLIITTSIMQSGDVSVKRQRIDRGNPGSKASSTRSVGFAP